MDRYGNGLIKMMGEYLNNVLGVSLKMAADGGQTPKLPYYLKAGNQFMSGTMNEMECLLIIPNALADSSAMARHAQEISKMAGIQPVLVLENIDAVRRRILVSNRTDFVVPGKQAYLPSMGAVFNERGMAQAATAARQQLSPAAQVLLLSHLQRKSLEGLIISEVARHFPYSIKTVSAAAKELEQTGICSIQGDNSGKTLHFLPKGEIWNVAYPMLTNPIQEVLYCDDISVIPTELRFVTFDKALAAYTFIADFDKKAYAVNKNDETIKALKNGGALNAAEGMYRIELWRYDPALLTGGDTIDALSLALCYKDTDDERVAHELNNMINKICRD